MSSSSEQFSRVLIDKELEYSGWDMLNPQQVRFEVSGQSGRAQEANEQRSHELLMTPTGL